MNKYRIRKAKSDFSENIYFYVEKYTGWVWGWEHVKVCSTFEEAKTYIPTVFYCGD